MKTLINTFASAIGGTIGLCWMSWHLIRRSVKLAAGRPVHNEILKLPFGM